MKNIITIIAVLFATATFAQSTSPKWGTAKNQDNTYRVLDLKKVTLTDVAGDDTLAITPKAYSSYVALAALDSVTLRVVTTFSSQDDRIVLVAAGTSGDKVKFIGSNLKTAGTATLSSGAIAVFEFIFNGTAWVEKSRVVQ
jgi:hypothetical protein